MQAWPIASRGSATGGCGPSRSGPASSSGVTKSSGSTAGSISAAAGRLRQRCSGFRYSAPAGGSRRYSDADVALLQRISELTSLGMNLVGVKRVLDLERRVAELEAEIEAMRSKNEGAVSEAIRETERTYRRDLVPLRQTVTIYEAE